MTMRGTSLGLARCAIGLATMAGAAATAHAGTFRWINAGGGVFGEGANWDLSAPPGEFDAVIFDLATAYTIDFAAGASTSVATVEAGDMLFDLGGFEYTMQQADIATGAGQSAALEVRNGRFSPLFGLRVGVGDGSYGELRATGAGARAGVDSVTVGVVGRLGDLASALLRIDAGARMDVYSLDIHGEAVVDGAGSLFRAREVDITGRMTFSNGAFSSTEAWQVSGELVVSDSTIVAENGFFGIDGSIVTLTRGSIEATTAETGLSRLRVEHSGSLTASRGHFQDGILELGLSAESFVAGGPILSFQLGLLANSALQLSFLDGFAPSVGDSLHLIHLEAATTGSFADPFSSVQLLSPPAWMDAQIDIVHLNDSGGYDAFLTFIPAPGAGATLLVGFATIAGRRRR